MKTKTQYVCQQCGATSPKWIGRCPTCQQWNTFVEERIGPAAGDAPPSWDSLPIRFTEITDVDTPRFSTGITEFDRVLGGGVVAGALVLIGGDPGVGKSTLMLDVASRLAESSAVLYASGEESAQQIKLRGDRLALRTADLHIYAEMSVKRIGDESQEAGASAAAAATLSSTNVFHCWQDGHRPIHLGEFAPHCWQTYWVFVLIQATATFSRQQAN